MRRPLLADFVYPEATLLGRQLSAALLVADSGATGRFSPFPPFLLRASSFRRFPCLRGVCRGAFLFEYILAALFWTCAVGGLYPAKTELPQKPAENFPLAQLDGARETR